MPRLVTTIALKDNDDVHLSEVHFRCARVLPPQRGATSSRLMARLPPKSGVVRVHTFTQPDIDRRWSASKSIAETISSTTVSHCPSFVVYRRSLITATTIFFQLVFSVGMMNVMGFAGVTPSDSPIRMSSCTRYRGGLAHVSISPNALRLRERSMESQIAPQSDFSNPGGSGDAAAHPFAAHPAAARLAAARTGGAG
jgi:hypothetical protein